MNENDQSVERKITSKSELKSTYSELSPDKKGESNFI
jgi:hypothetical protein